MRKVIDNANNLVFWCHFLNKLRLVQTYCVKRISLGCFLCMGKTQPVRKFSILLGKPMWFTQVWTRFSSLGILFTLCNNNKHSNINLIDRHQFPWLTVSIVGLVLLHAVAAVDSFNVSRLLQQLAVRCLPDTTFHHRVNLVSFGSLYDLDDDDDDDDDDDWILEKLNVFKSYWQNFIGVNDA